MIRIGIRRVFRSRRRALAALVPVGALLGVFVMSGPASAASFPDTPAPVILGLNGLCLDNAGNVVANFNPVDIWPCRSQDNQLWWADPYDSSIRLAFFNLMCLDVRGGYNFNGNSVDIYQCNGSLAQQWIPGPYNHEIENVGTGKCLDDSNFSSGWGSHLEIWQCKPPGANNSNQYWTFG